MKKKMRQAAFLLAILFPLATVGIARADTKEEARRHFDRAVELVDDGQLEGALVEFQRSYDLTQHFAVLYNIGQVLVSLARPVEAYDAYQRYLAAGGSLVPSARRTEVEKEMARQKARIATLDVRGLPEGASLRVDGKEMGKAPLAAPLRVAVGKHVVAASAEGYAATTTEVTVAGEDYKVVSLVMTKNAVQAAPAAAPVASLATPVSPPPVAPALGAPLVIEAPAAPPAREPMSKLRIAGIVMGAVGVAGLAAAGGFWLAAKSRHEDALTANDSDQDRAESLQSEAEGFVKATNISLVAGGTLVGLGVAAFFLGAPKAPAPVGTGVQAYVLPSVGVGTAGLCAGGTW
jgi:hypothetical protein